VDLPSIELILGIWYLVVGTWLGLEGRSYSRGAEKVFIGGEICFQSIFYLHGAAGKMICE
jgi:hypothetical protein